MVTAYASRVSEEEREHVVERLKTAFVDGRLDQQAFGLRVQQALVAQTRADLAPLLVDLEAPPAVPVYRPPAARPTHPAARRTRPAAGERGWAMLGHLLGFTSFVGPLVIFLTKGSRSPFVRRQAAESVNFQLTFVIFHLLAVVAAGATFGLGAILYAIVFVPVVLGWVVLMLVGGVTALAGNEFRYPLTVRLVR